MTGARVRLIVAAALFGGWMLWLALAVLDKGKVDPVSRAQLTEANILVTAEVVAGPDGKPSGKVKIAKRISTAGPVEGSEIEVANLPQAVVPDKGFPGTGIYLLPLVTRDNLIFSIAGLPRSPGYEAITNPPHPRIYPWTEATQAQLRSLGYGL